MLSPQVRSKVLAMVMEGEGVDSITEATGVPRSTVYYIRAHMDEDNPELARKLRQSKIAAKTAALLEGTLDDIADGTVNVSPQQLAVMYGIATDKEQRQQQIDQAKQAHDEDVEDRRRIAATADALTQALSEGRATIVDGRILAIDGEYRDADAKVAQRPSQLSATSNPGDHASDYD